MPTYFSSIDYTQGTCCLYDCFKPTDETKAPPYSKYGIEYKNVPKYFICPSTASDYKFCGKIDGINV